MATRAAPAEAAVVEAAVAAARAAGAVSRHAFLAAERGQLPQVEEKRGFFDIVTLADREAETAAARAIFDRVPHSRILGEEGGWQGEGGVTWYVDPIDGTSNFACGLPFFCASVAAYGEDGTPICGAVYDPMRDEMFLARGGTLTLNGGPVTAVRRAVRDSEAELLTNLPREGAPPSDGELARFGRLVSSFRAVRRLGSCALQLAYVAAGRASVGYDEMCYPWDIAAGLQLVEAGGGRIMAWDAQDRPMEHPLQALSRVERFVAGAPGFDLEGSAVVRTRRAQPAAAPALD
ncbi:inositol monophosphatase family protein [Aureimonas populi]|uniref:Inositol monophosphatase family protein n=1 Tax=Aureimonas populi TaxID=1701758 RepID=A0ABW5CSL2_9HYPH|nr:inositol monophosphatase [Aureimonas populi]